jgi:hypothetical protein
MKIYLLMTSLALAAGTSLGYWTGQGSAETGFAQGCAETGIVVVYDHQSEAHRHFHCFELEHQQSPERQKTPRPGKFVTL